MASYIQAFDLAQCDMAYAFSQDGINASLADYLNSLSENTVSWAYDVNGDNQFVTPQDPENPMISFTGVLGPPQDPDLFILDFSNPGANNAVVFNVTFASATFKSSAPPAWGGGTFVQGATQWALAYDVQLKQCIVQDTATLPTNAANQLAAIEKTYNTVFDLNQILIDLSTGTPNDAVISNPPAGMSSTTWTMLLNAMAFYLSTNSATVFPSLPAAGYAATGGTGSVPTYAPTAAQFVLLGNTTNPGLSSIVWALMTQNDAMPSNPAIDFIGADFFDSPSTLGVAIISSRKFYSYLTGCLPASLIQAAAQYCETVISGGNITWTSASLSNPGSFTTSSTPAAQIASWTMAQQHNGQEISNSCVGHATTDSNLTVSFGQVDVTEGYNQLTASGSIAVSADYQTISRTPEEWSSPTFTFAWTANYSVEPTNSGGGVEFVYSAATSSFPTSPTSQSGGDAGWGQHIPSDILTKILANAVSGICSNLSAGMIGAMSSMSDFVFCGGGTFYFSNPGVSSKFALYTTIQYQNPD